MKKPEVERYIIQSSLKEWEELKARLDLSDQDKAVQDTRDHIRKDHNEKQGQKIAAILKALKLTKRQTQIFASYTETNSYSETARLLDIKKQTVYEVVCKIRASVKIELGILPDDPA